MTEYTIELPELHPSQAAAKAVIDANRFVAIRCGRRWGKLLCVRTLIPTPSGWTTMGELAVGDEIFAADGKPCRVVAATDIVHDAPSNKIVFSDGTIVVACDDHLWLTTTHKERKNTARGYCQGPTVRRTSEIRDTVTYGKRGDRNHAVANCRSVECLEREFSIPPYVLGVWLGDGNSTDPVYSKPDQEIVDAVRAEGFPVREMKVEKGKCPQWTWADKRGGDTDVRFISRLREIGVYDDKHIPPAYLRGSVGQRLSLLQGLMDTDGYSDESGTCEFCSVREILARGVLELTRSLGIRSYLIAGRVTLGGEDYGLKYRVKFTTSAPVFRLSRKLDALKGRVARFNTEQRMIVSVESCESVPMRCIAVDSPTHLYLASEAFIPTHNTDLDKSEAAETALEGFPVGWFAPEYKFVSEAYNEIADILDPVITQSSKVDGVIRLITGGRIDFWSLDNERAGRSRKYKLAILDEAAFTKPNMLDVWQKSIRPTLLDLGGKCVVTSNTNGIDPDNFLYRICPRPGETVSEFGFVEFHATTASNPYMPRAEVAKLQADNHPLVYQQEYLAEFVDWSGAAFFSQDSLLVGGRPVADPSPCSVVFAVIDSAVKTGKANDGTGVVYFAYVGFGAEKRLVVLDYDVQQIEGALLETWLPTVFDNLEAMAKKHRAIHGTQGVWIEDKSSGMILLQQAMRRGKNVHAIDSKLTAVGKDERAISVSGYVYRGMVKLARGALERVVGYKGTTRNHLLGQVVGFRVGDKDAAKRQDDLLDCFTYGVALALGDEGGF